MNLFNKQSSDPEGFFPKHPVLANIIVICLVALLGIWIVYLSLQLFTKHGDIDKVPGVENLSYTEAIKILHGNGFRVDIRDSLYMDDIKPGYVIEQFPKAGAEVKPGRKIFLYINAVHPKEVIVDDDNNPTEDALKSYSFRQGMARLEELGFKNIKVVRVLGDNDCIVKVTANGQTVKKTQKVPVNAAIVVEVYDGRLSALRDSLQNEEYLQNVYYPEYSDEDETSDPLGDGYSSEPEDDDPTFTD